MSKIKYSHKIYFAAFLLFKQVTAFGTETYFHEQWYLKNSGQNFQVEINDIKSTTLKGKLGADIDYPLVEEIDIEKTMTKDAVIAVIDYGIDPTHPALNDKIDSTRAKSFIGPKSKINDDFGHGTHVAGIIAASSKNGGIRGISERIKILPLKVLSSKEKSTKPLSNMIADAINYAVAQKVDAINLSLGIPQNMETIELDLAINNAIKNNIPVIAAAGNNNHFANNRPCNHQFVVCVGAFTQDGTRSIFSNYGHTVDFMAPGSNILSTIPMSKTPLFFNETGFDFKNGTSQATPMVTALFALLKISYPKATIDDLYRKVAKATRKDDQSSLFGKISYRNTFLNEDTEDLVIPTMKDTHEIKVQDGQFEIRYNIKNYENKNTAVKLIIDEEIIEFELNKFEQKAFTKTYKIDSNAPNQLTKNIKINNRSFTLEFNLYKSQENTNTKILNINSNLLSYKSENKRGMLNTDLLTLSTGQNSFKSPFFYQQIKKEQSDSTDILIYQYSESTNNLDLIGTAQLRSALGLNFFKMIDIDNDGNDDLILGTIRTNPENKKKFLEYSFFQIKDNALAPLFKNYQWKFTPEVAVFDSRTIDFRTTGNDIFGNIKTPYFITEGGLNKTAQINDPWFPTSNIKETHAYYLKPTLIENEIILETQVIDNEHLKNRIKKQYKLNWQDSIQLIAKEKDTLIFSISGHTNKTLIYNLDNQATKLIDINLAGYTPVTNRFDQSITLFEKHSSNTLELFFNTNYKKIKLSDPLDNIEAVVAYDNQNIIVLTKNNLLSINYQENKPVISSVKIERFSFVDGNTFNESYFPFKTKSNLYIYKDATDLDRNYIQMMKINQSKIESRWFNTLEIINENKVCRALNPVTISEMLNFSKICLDKTTKEASLEFTPIDN